MNRLFQTIALFVATACFVWVGVLWHWQTTQRDMSEEDIAVYLVALPLTLFALALLGRWAWRGAVRQAHEREASAAAVPCPAPTLITPDETERRATLQLLAAHLNCPAGESPAAVLKAAEEGAPRPELDPVLRDDDGLPLMTARIRDLDADALDLDAAEEAVRARAAARQYEALRPEMRRALAALQRPLENTLAALRPWRERLGLEDAPSGPASQSMLRLLPLWPPNWTANETAVARQWLLAQLQAAELVAPHRIAELPLAPGCGWLEAERVVRTLEREDRADLLLVTACHSDIGDASVLRLQAEGRLFTSRTATRPIAGEAAATLVLAPASWPIATEDGLPVHLHRAAIVARDKSIDADGRTGAQAAQTCVEQALASGLFAPEAIAAAVHDADQHTPRAAEALTTLLNGLPHLQPADDMRQTGMLNGQAGVAAPLLVIALAAHQAQHLGRPCLALSVDDTRLRLALVARPAASDPTAATQAPA